MQGHFPLDCYEERRDLTAGAGWASSTMSLATGMMWVPAPKVHRVPAPVRADDMEMAAPLPQEVRFGFAGPDDRAVSLTIPAAVDGGQDYPFNSFDIEYDPEQPDMLTVCLLETDQDNFIHTVRKSAPFPARLLTELLNRRKATAQEMAAWHSACDEEE